jgi:hypothetical protein
MPLGSDSKASEKALVTAKKNSLLAQSQTLNNEIESSFLTMTKSLALLNQGLQSQEANSENLKISYKEMERKFQQGRVPVATLISEQDALFQSELQEISFRKQIAHLLLDYLSVFSSFPCQWNQLAAAQQGQE